MTELADPTALPAQPAGPTLSALPALPALPGAGGRPASAARSGAGHIDSLSPSRAADFMTCPLLYRFRVVDRLPSRPTQAATRGTMVHAVLERLFDLPAQERTPDRAHALLGPTWERLLAEDPELGQLFPAPADATDVTATPDTPAAPGTPDVATDPAEAAIPQRDSPTLDAAALDAWMASARALLDRYFELEDPRRLEPAEREMFVETQLESGLVLRGYVDRLDVAPSGDTRVVDYKTGRSPGVQFESKAMFQMRFYALVLWRLQGRIPRMLQLLYLGNGEVLRYSPDEADLRATERKLHALWLAIRQAEASGSWQPRRSRLCDWCDHQALCPEFGGTPPPLPERAPAAPAAAADDVPNPRSVADDL